MHVVLHSLLHARGPGARFAMKKGKPARNATLKRGRRSREEKAAGRWRLSIREIKVRKAAYEWTTFMVQGFKDAGGKRARKKFKTKAAAEAFVAMKSLENVTPDMPQRPVITNLSAEQVKEAESVATRND